MANFARYFDFVREMKNTNSQQIQWKSIGRNGTWGELNAQPLVPKSGSHFAGSSF